MPNVLTHGLMAQRVFETLSEGDVVRAIKAHPQVFKFASNGPDFLFYYNAWPWMDQDEAKRVSEYGEQMHRGRVNQFVDTMIDLAKKQNQVAAKRIMIAFVAGYLCHWALDSVAHPFVFYRSGSMKGNLKYYHFRYESNLDVKMVRDVFKLKLKDYPTRSFLNMTHNQEDVVAFLVSETHKKTFNSDITKEDCLLSMKHAKSILVPLFDPTGVMYLLTRGAERVIANNLWKFSSHMVSSNIDESYDELNLSRSLWKNPAEPSITSNATFLDLFDESIDRGFDAIEHLEKMISGEVSSMAPVILDRNFNSGHSTFIEMFEFDNIYLKK
ncbi:MAG: zinc dependent phospholipase C family protein [Erysipelothrix sp.]|nr:zinc dependent phospholipase C family protein [Erysipelothrix sp.]